MKKLSITLLITLPLLMGSSLFAATESNSGAAFIHHFDSDKDGKVSLDEFRAPGDQSFKTIDADGDGFATAEEAAAFEQKMRDMMIKRKQAVSKSSKDDS
jgi:Ca2+-binding EF-hand superfamily protein